MPVNLDSVYPPPLKLEPFRKKGSAGFSRDWQQILSGLQQRHIQQGRKTVHPALCGHHSSAWVRGLFGRCDHSHWTICNI